MSNDTIAFTQHTLITGGNGCVLGIGILDVGKLTDKPNELALEMLAS